MPDGISEVLKSTPWDEATRLKPLGFSMYREAAGYPRDTP